jgi:hypothetical protein
MVKRICQALKPGGFFLFQFQRALGTKSSRRTELIRRIIARLTLGNLTYEPGDMLWGNAEFIHAFGSDDEVRLEIEEGGLSILNIQTSPTNYRGCVVCKKELES